MELRREVLLAIGSLVLVNLLLAFGSIGLFVRMGPAIERILQENVYSITATEEILGELAAAGSAPLPDDARARVGQALQRAQRNVTEDAERPVLDTLERRLPAALAGDRASREVVIADLQRLIRINRDAMGRVDEEARRLGSAGAWAAVLLGFLSFLLSLLVVVRLQRSFVRPLLELSEVMDRVHRGDRWRRCHARAAPREVLRVMEAVNRLLDERVQRDRARDEPGSEGARAAIGLPTASAP
ncbi:MAG: hypothetical protein JW751_02480 [Polyangiaceae bacterium]|nr:hypothetical protein [Polyangiaceae bacterium]